MVNPWGVFMGDAPGGGVGYVYRAETTETTPAPPSRIPAHTPTMAGRASQRCTPTSQSTIESSTSGTATMSIATTRPSRSARPETGASTWRLNAVLS